MSPVEHFTCTVHVLDISALKMKLSHRAFGGQGPPLVILHGLLGSSRNWMAAGRELKTAFRVLAPDLRNHGESPHAAEHDFEVMAADVLQWLDERGLEKVFLMGHSMGGKTAMRIACQRPERVRALVAVDIAPREKEPSYRREIEALLNLPLDAIRSRADADRILSEAVGDLAMRQFLLTGLVRSAEGRWSWQPNLRVLVENLHLTGKAPIGPEDRFEGPALFVLGETSDFVRKEDQAEIRRHFPAVRIETIAGAGHNPHVEAKEEFVRAVIGFLSENGL